MRLRTIKQELEICYKFNINQIRVFIKLYAHCFYEMFQWFTKINEIVSYCRNISYFYTGFIKNCFNLLILKL